MTTAAHTPGAGKLGSEVTGDLAAQCGHLVTGTISRSMLLIDDYEERFIVAAGGAAAAFGCCCAAFDQMRPGTDRLAVADAVLAFVRGLLDQTPPSRGVTA